MGSGSTRLGGSTDCTDDWDEGVKWALASSRHWKKADLSALEFQPEATPNVRYYMVNSVSGRLRCLSARRRRATLDGSISVSKWLWSVSALPVIKPNI
ncbi:hypothetical protein CRENBAI_002488 [Crenichthys baileyi]|uniref:Uncharacterized protein n=1 Tax=Crenichthys baileyi TaxID=28760 RepID=A0AAV9SUL3_9TELE